MQTQPKIYIIGGQITEIPQIAEATQYPQIQKQFHPRTHPNIKLQQKIQKKLHKQSKFTKKIHSLTELEVRH